MLEKPLLSDEDPTDNKRRNEKSNKKENEKVLSRNVPIALGFTGLAFISRSLWNQNVLSMFIYQVSGYDSRVIGYITSFMGLAQLAASFPSGYLSDKYRRDTVIRCSAVVGIVSIALVVSSIALKNLYFIAGAFAVVGTYWGLTTTSISALFADSLLEEDRSKYITWRYTIQKIGNLAAPLLAITVFAFSKNHWSEDDCACTIYISQGLCLFSTILPCFMSDDFALSDQESSTLSQSNTSDDESLSESSLRSADCENQLCFSDERDKNEPSDEAYDKVIPFCICLADILQGFANGMSVQFFPVFFAKTLQMRPIYVQIVYFCSQSGQACGSILSEKIGTFIGRCQAAAALRVLGAVVLSCMILTKKLGASTPIVCTLYVVRMILTNSSVPLTGTVLMNNVPKNYRGRWGSLDSLVKASWSGSALLGGLIIHKFGIYSVFYVTIAIQMVATIPLFFLFKRVQK